MSLILLISVSLANKALIIWRGNSTGVRSRNFFQPKTWVKWRITSSPRELVDAEPRREIDISAVPLDELVKALLAGGLTQSIERIAKQQAVLRVGSLSDSANSAAAKSGEAVKPETTRR